MDAVLDLDERMMDDFEMEDAPFEQIAGDRNPDAACDEDFMDGTYREMGEDAAAQRAATMAKVRDKAAAVAGTTAKAVAVTASIGAVAAVSGTVAAATKSRGMLEHKIGSFGSDLESYLFDAMAVSNREERIARSHPGNYGNEPKSKRPRPMPSTLPTYDGKGGNEGMEY